MQEPMQETPMQVPMQELDMQELSNQLDAQALQDEREWEQLLAAYRQEHGLNLSHPFGTEHWQQFMDTDRWHLPAHQQHGPFGTTGRPGQVVYEEEPDEYYDTFGFYITRYTISLPRSLRRERQPFRSVIASTRLPRRRPFEMDPDARNVQPNTEPNAQQMDAEPNAHDDQPNAEPNGEPNAEPHAQNQQPGEPNTPDKCEGRKTDHSYTCVRQMSPATEL